MEESGIAPSILDLGTRWDVSYQHHAAAALSPEEIATGTNCIGGKVTPEPAYEMCKRGNLSCPVERVSNPSYLTLLKAGQKP